MQTMDITISLPESVARAAESQGLLTSKSIEHLLLDEMEHRAYQEEVEAIRLGIAECDQGKALPARVALEGLRQRHGISR